MLQKAWDHVGNEQVPGCLGYIGDRMQPRYVGITMNHYKDTD